MLKSFLKSLLSLTGIVSFLLISSVALSKSECGQLLDTLDGKISQPLLSLVQTLPADAPVEAQITFYYRYNKNYMLSPDKALLIDRLQQLGARFNQHSDPYESRVMQSGVESFEIVIPKTGLLEAAKLEGVVNLSLPGEPLPLADPSDEHMIVAATEAQGILRDAIQRLQVEGVKVHGGEHEIDSRPMFLVTAPDDAVRSLLRLPGITVLAPAGGKAKASL